MSTVLCTSTTVFACMSKSCAPPPVGTGGSSPSGTSGRWTGGEATVRVRPMSEETLSDYGVSTIWMSRDNVIKNVGRTRESFPDDFMVSEAQDAAIRRVGQHWISLGVEGVRKFRGVAKRVREHGIDDVAEGKVTADLAENFASDFGEAVTVARVLTAIRSAPKTTVWRGMQVSQEVMDGLKPGEIFFEPLATATGRKVLATRFAKGEYDVGERKSGRIPVLLKLQARNVPIYDETGSPLVKEADERMISGRFRVVSSELTGFSGPPLRVITLEQIDD